MPESFGSIRVDVGRILIKVQSNNGRQPTKKHGLALICGDGRDLPQELQLFRRFGLKHDAFCVGRSLQAYIPYVSWAPAAVNYIWLDEDMFTYARDQVEDHITRHSVFFAENMQPAIDFIWTDDNNREIKTWAGSSAFFALKIAIKLKYDKILLCGVPMDAQPHWYDDPDTVGPQWTPETLRAWGKFAAQEPKQKRIRSCSGYTQYLFGGPNAGWFEKKTVDSRANRA